MIEKSDLSSWLKPSFLAVAITCAGAVHAQSVPPTKLSAEYRLQVAAQIETSLRERYVFPAIGDAAAARLAASVQAGEFDHDTDSGAFSKHLNDVLLSVVHDKHLAVAALGDPPRGVFAHESTSEAGVIRADRLKGNIGYLDLAGFVSPDISKSILDGAMASLAGTRALIIDLRLNAGGDSDEVTYLASFFVQTAEPMKLFDFVERVPGTLAFHTISVWTTATPTKYLDRPIFVLTSKATISAGESLAYAMQAAHLARVVGEITQGAANPQRPVRLPDGLLVTVPFAKPVSPFTGTNWEGKGVIPDVPSTASDALAVAMMQLDSSDTHTDVQALSEVRLVSPRTTQQQGSEAALRRYIGGILAGAPPYDDLLPTLAETVRRQLAMMAKDFDKLGSISAIRFVGVDERGLDEFSVEFEHGVVMFSIVMGTGQKIALVRSDRPLFR